MKKVYWVVFTGNQTIKCKTRIEAFDHAYRFSENGAVIIVELENGGIERKRFLIELIK